MKRVGSVGSMAEAGGSAFDLTKRFLAKTVLLVACVYLLSAKAETMPRLVLELVYGKPCVVQSTFVSTWQFESCSLSKYAKLQNVYG